MNTNKIDEDVKCCECPFQYECCKVECLWNTHKYERKKDDEQCV